MHIIKKLVVFFRDFFFLCYILKNPRFGQSPININKIEKWGYKTIKIIFGFIYTFCHFI